MTDIEKSIIDLIENDSEHLVSHVTFRVDYDNVYVTFTDGPLARKEVKLDIFVVEDPDTDRFTLPDGTRFTEDDITKEDHGHEDTGLHYPFDR